MSQNLRIGELANRAGTSCDTLRYYERRELLPRPQRTSGGFRLYAATAVERVIFIRRAQALGLTLDDVREILRVADRGTPPCEHVRETLVARLADIDARIAELESLRATLKGTLARSRRLPLTKSCICDIIESESPNREKQ